MIKIITVYNSLNPGSYLQALALYEILSKKYGDVSFLFTKTRNPVLESVKQSLKLLMKKRFKYAYNQFIMGIDFKKITSQFNISKKINDDDIYVLGSDEIWNVAREEMSKYPIFWGYGLNQKRCISYAPSINYATKEQLASHEYVKKSLKNIYSLSVRDKYSKDVLQQIENRDILEVCDPTLLLDREYYKKIEKEKKYDNYIFVYAAPSKLTQEAIREIMEYAKKTNRKLVSYNIYHSWCDEVMYGKAGDFLSLVHNADCVFTSTFHGTVFSLIYNKQFIVFGDNQKVKEMLKKVHLNNFYKKDSIEKMIMMDFDYSKINKIMSDERSIGLDYLYTSIDNLDL